MSLQRIEGQSRRHYSERCSAFLVGFDDREAILLSAWHCIDGQLSPLRQPTVLVRDNTVEVTIVESGKAMNQDWLVMRAPRAAFTSLTPIRVSDRPVVNDESLIAIGWGRGTDWTDIEASALNCPVISASSALTLRCGLTKGDSGGVVARLLENGQLEAVGIISSGDSISLSYAFPSWRLPNIFD
ncbi:MAG: trypsin-like peptidase domain-containing protein [Pseudomonadota bacterium]|nr:trypsin-like peptidase domain-containing protein [Pseudomonadota bacterium]